MFDTMTLNKIGAGVCGALLVYLLCGWAAESIYGGGHGEEEQGYKIAVLETGAGGEGADAGPAFEELYAAADAAAGQGLFRPCAACHSVDPGVNGAGPSLFGVVDRAPGTEAGYTFSGGFAAVADAWTPENLNHFIESPKGMIATTTMSYNGMRGAQDRANLIAYLATLK